jgi:hypothetical protein
LLANRMSEGYDVSSNATPKTRTVCSQTMPKIQETIQMQPTEPTPAQIELIRNLVKSVTTENALTEYEKARIQFTSTEEFQAALRFVEHEIQHHLTLIEHLHHLATLSLKPLP